MIELLKPEAFERRQNRGLMHATSLGACIRHITVNNDGYSQQVNELIPQKTGKSTKDSGEGPNFDSADKIQQFHASAVAPIERMCAVYRPNVLFVVSTLPYLESLDMNQADWTRKRDPQDQNLLIRVDLGSQKLLLYQKETKTFLLETTPF